MPYRKAYAATALPNRSNNWLLRIGGYGTLILGASAVALIWLGALYFSHAEYEQTGRAALTNAENLSRAFEEQIVRSVRTADQTLLYARDAYAHDPEHFDMSVWTHNSEFLTGINFQIALIDKTGRMIASNIPGAKPGIDLSDREHFKVHLGAKTDELFISKPILGRVSNKWSIQATRRIIMPDGSFGGVVVASLDPDYFATFYRSIDVGANGTVTLVGIDGIVRARGARGSSQVGESLLGTALFRALSHANTGAYTATSKLDGIDRQFVYRQVKGYPLIVVIGLAQDEIFHDYRAKLRTDMFIAAALTLWLVAMTTLMWLYQRALARSRDAAEAGTRARSEFLAMMSHEIRTPMNGVVGMSEVLLESGLSTEQLSFARTLRESAEYLLQLINDVLDFSKLEADRIDIESICFDLRSMVESSIGALAGTAKDAHLTLSVDIDADVPAAVVGDPARIRQVLFNLVGNGLKFTPAGGVGVRVAVLQEPTAPGHVRLLFTVTDTGIGIPADGIPLLFREFSQLDSSIARRFGGTGLGLAICKRLVDLMGGSITVESTVGQGTTFRFTVDCLVGDSAHMTGLAEATLVPVLGADQPARSLRILLVEDNKTNQLVATKLLRRLGHDADIAANGLEAVAACKAAAYDLVFMDVMMPEMDGLTAAREVRKLPAPFGTPYIIALTANTMKHDRDLCLDAGMNDFLPKPVTRASLEAAMGRYMRVAPAATSSTQAPVSAPAPAGATDCPPFAAAIYRELADALGPEDSTMVLRSFADDVPARIAEMRRAAAASDNETVKREAHAIKSSAASLGFLHLSDAARGLERHALGLSWPALTAEVGIVAKAFEAIEAIIHNELGGVAASTLEQAAADHV